MIVHHLLVPYFLLLLPLFLILILKHSTPSPFPLPPPSEQPSIPPDCIIRLLLSCFPLCPVALEPFFSRSTNWVRAPFPSAGASVKQANYHLIYLYHCYNVS